MRHIKQKLVAFDEATKNAITAEEKLQWQSEFNRLSVKLKSREGVLRDFCNQTGLKRDRYREQVFSTKTENGLKNWGKSTSQKAVWGNKYLDFIKNDAIIKAKSGLPTKIILPNEKIKQTVDVSIGNIQGIVPKGADAENVYVMAGNGTSVPIRDLKRLYITYGKSPQKWQKKSADVYTDNFKYVIHWYEHDGFVSASEIKLKGIKAMKK